MTDLQRWPLGETNAATELDWAPKHRGTRRAYGRAARLSTVPRHTILLVHHEELLIQYCWLLLYRLRPPLPKKDILVQLSEHFRI